MKAIDGTTSPSIPIDELEDLAQAYLVLNREKVSPSTTTRRLTSLRGFARWCGLTDFLSDFIAPEPGKTIPHPIPEGSEGLERMIQQAKNPMQRALVALGGFVGLRVGESIGVRPDNFNVDGMLLTVRGKGDKTRTVPLSDRAWEHLMIAYVFAVNDGNRPLVNYKDRFARQSITDMAARAKLSRPVRSHDLRATFATEAYNKSLDLRVVQNLLGHSSSTTTEIYTGVGLNKMRDAVQF